MARRTLVPADALAAVGLAAAALAAVPGPAGARPAAAPPAPHTVRFVVNLVFPLVGGPCGYRATSSANGADLGCVEDADVKAIEKAQRAAVARLSDDGKGGTFSTVPVACVTAAAVTVKHARRAGSFPDAPLGTYPFLHLVSGVRVKVVAPAGPAWRACKGV